ncbi:MAG: type II toxin-antitoxin system RelE/ParE family toxin [Alphaproteobacteria bacterium]|nr:type II toxin-antitoxin system RelE/ParE family toxin [Alphaproteobacteria bacterium]
MTWQLKFTSSARKELHKLPRDQQVRIAEAVRRLALNPRPPGCKKLKGSPNHRIRVGDYRVIYSVDEGQIRILILAIAHRREVYRR